jgi:hypothetical protein
MGWSGAAEVVSPLKFKPIQFEAGQARDQGVERPLL